MCHPLTGMATHKLNRNDLGAGVMQPFNCFIVQSRQVMQSMGMSVDWTWEDE